LSKKYKRALPRLAEVKASHEGLTGSLEARLVKKWSESEEKAMKEWGDALRVFDVVEKKGTEICRDNNRVHDPDIKENGNQLRHRMKSG
jgi:hypothetical protein